MYEASSLHVSYLDFDKVLGSLTLTAGPTLHYTTLHYTTRGGFGGPLVMTMFEGP